MIEQIIQHPILTLLTLPLLGVGIYMIFRLSSAAILQSIKQFKGKED